MNFKKILISSIFMVIGLQASEVDPKRDFLQILRSSDSIFSSELIRNDLKGLNLIVTQYPEIAQDPDVLIRTITLNPDAAVVELLLQNGAVPDVGAMETIIKQMYTYRDSHRYIMEHLKKVLKVLMQYGGKVDRDLTVVTKVKVPGVHNSQCVHRYRKSVLDVPEFAEIINEIKAEIEEDETRALAAFMAEAGWNTKMATEMHQILGNSEKSLGRSAELKK